MSHDTLLRREDAVLVLVDVQEKLLPAIAEGEAVARRCGVLLEGARILEVPVLVTEQYPRGLGRTVAPLLEAASGATVYEKMTFSCARDDAFLDALEAYDRDQILLCGIESHVCVLQTALDLVENNLQVHVAADAVGSRDPQNRESALARMGREGVIVTNTESALFEMLVVAGTPEFKQVSKLLR
jgi:nicotinamidase-related amidase